MPEVGSGQTLGPVQTEWIGFLERVTRDRWIHEGQRPEFTVYDSVRSWTEIRKVWRPDFLPEFHTLRMKLGETVANLSVTERDRDFRGTVTVPPIQFGASGDPEERAGFRRRRLIGDGARLNLPAARFWEVGYVPPLGASGPGFTWSDTLAFVADPGEGLREEMSGVWHFRMVGDTAISGRAGPLLEMTAEVHYRSETLEDDGEWVGTYRVTRDVAGATRGWVALDAETGLRTAGADSSSWTGTATLTTADGRSFETPARYEQIRAWRLEDSTEWALAQDSIETRRRLERRSMVRLPAGPFQTRLARGDSLLADSLLDIARTTRDREKLASIRHDLTFWGNHTSHQRTELEARKEELYLAEGDTTGIFGSLVGPPWTEEKLDLLLPYMEDLGELWRLGRQPGFTYRQTAANLMRSTPLLQPDSSQWQCTPEACRRILALLDTSQEPRLRDVALTVAATRDPARWYERLRARADSGSLVGERTLDLLDGVANGKPLPPVGSDWRAWAGWLSSNGQFRDNHRDAILMHTATTGREIVGEIRDLWPTRSDSGRVVVGTILRGMDTFPPLSLEELAREVREGSPVQARTAAREALDRIEAEGRTAPREVMEELLTPFLEWEIMGGEYPWPEHVGGPLPPADSVLPRRSRRERAAPDSLLYLKADSLPGWLTAPWESRIPMVRGGGWTTGKNGTWLSVGLPKVWGPFARVTSGQFTLRDRGPNQRPLAVASGNEFLLLNTERGWVILLRGQWIT